MVSKALWVHHPHVRTGTDLTFGERASDVMKHWFGTWTVLGSVAAFVGGWLLFANDPGELILNLTLSCIAAVQGIILQIAANRGDRISSELALATHANGEELLTLNKQQLQILTEIQALREDVKGAIE